MAAMKSAVELAMEKLGQRRAQEPSTPLTDQQRQEIGELRKQYDAKIAEKEIMVQAELRRLVQQHAPHEAAAAAQEVQKQLQQTKAELRQELEAKIAAVRSRQ
jgi:Spy/CpxP family protein refolding chaperone